jgi:hypothetical protein
MRAILADLFASMRRNQMFRLVYATNFGEAQLMLAVPAAMVSVAEKYILAKYPDIEIERRRRLPSASNGDLVWGQSLRLKPDIQPLLAKAKFDDHMQRNFVDPVSTLLQTVQDIPEDSERATTTVRSMVRITVTKATAWQHWRAKRLLQQLNNPWWGTHTTLKDIYAHYANGSWYQRMFTWPVTCLLRRVNTVADESSDKVNSSLCRASIELISWSNPADAPLARKQLSVMAGAFAEFTEHGRCKFVASRVRKGLRKAPTSLLSDADLAQLWHVPTDTVHTPTLARPTIRQLPPPATLPTARDSAGAAKLGRVAFGNDNRVCYLPPRDRIHYLITGKSGCGKSTLMHNLVTHDAFSGAGIGVIDPHSDLIDDIVSTLPRSRTNDVVLADVADRQCPVTFNPLECSDPQHRPLIASSVLSTLKKVFGFDETNAPRLINTLRYTLLALLEQESTTLLDVRRVLVDKNYRKQVAGNLADEEVRSFWQDEVASWTDRYEKETMPAILNKLGQFTANPITRAILSESKGTLDLRQVMDRGQILLVSLSQGLIGEDAATLLGSLMVAGIQQAAMSRAELGKDQREVFNLYVDEYPVYVNESFATILSQARKYGLRLTGAQQYLDQVDPALMAAMFGNVSTLVSFQLAFDDAEVIANQLGEPLNPADLISLPKYHAVTRLAIDGVPSRPFILRTLPPPKRNRTMASAETIRKVSRRRYGRAA